MKKRTDKILTIIISIITIILYLLPTGFENKQNSDEFTIKEKVLVKEVNNKDIKTMGLVTVGSQELVIEILRGNFKGQLVKAKNLLMGQMSFDKIFKQGDKALAILKLDQEKESIISARASDIYRIDYELILFLLFALFLVSFAGWTGFKALLSFVFTAIAMWKILIPMFLKGYSPIPVAFIIITITTSVIILLISGFSRKGLVALIGSIAGISITTILALIFNIFFRIPGTVQDFSEMLLYTGFTHLRLSDIMISGIFIAAAGAVMDIAMDIATAQAELVEKVKDMSKKELIKSGFNIAYPVIGTMTTTLLFAYSGSFIFSLMVFMAKGTPLVNIVNMNYISHEILHTLVGSFGLVLVAPTTAIIGGYIYSKKNLKKPAILNS